MKQLALVTVLIVGGIMAWLFASRLSADALGMAVGLLFGVVAGIPTALLVLASNRRRRVEYDEDDEDGEPEGSYGPYGGMGRGSQRMLGQQFPYQPPVIVLAAPQAAPGPAGQWPNMQPYPQTVDSVGYPVRQALPGPGAPDAAGGRVFRVVGEKEEILDEW
jgi:hypothetical protein